MRIKKKKTHFDDCGNMHYLNLILKIFSLNFELRVVIKLIRFKMCKYAFKLYIFNFH